MSCSNQYITPAFIGFQLSDLDTLIVRTYEKDAGFSHLLDTGIVVSDTTYLRRNATFHDTTVILLNNIVGHEKYLFPDHDWQIFIPAKNRSISLSELVSPQNEQKCVAGGDLCPGCSNPIESFLQDGQQVVPPKEILNKYGYLVLIHS